MSRANAIRSALLVLGVVLIALSAILCLAVLTNLMPADAVAVAGHSGVRGIGGIAVAGCLLAALGSDDD